MTRILVTGASGLLGLNLALEAAKEHQVIGVLHSRALHGAPFDTVQADLLEDGAVERLLDDARSDWVVHCAALADVDDCEGQPELARQLNTELPGRLAAAAQERNLRFLHLSTDAVFDGRRGNYAETDEPSPISVYGHSKLEGEYAVMDQHPHAIVARVNFFGWSLFGNRSLGEFFYNNLQGGQTVNGLTDRDFCPLLANDLARILLRMLQSELKGLYHVVSADCVSKYDFGVMLADQFGLDAGLIQAATSEDLGYAAARPPKLTLDTRKLATALGQALPTVAEGIEGFYRLHQAGYPTQLRAMGAAVAIEES